MVARETPAVGPERPCPVCQGQMLPRFQTEEAEYCLCGACDYLKPWAIGLQPLDLNVEIYRKRIGTRLATLDEIEPRRRRRYARLLRTLAGYRRTGRFLDIGCGEGRLLQVIEAHGWEAWGADPAMADVTPDHDDAGRRIAKTVHECNFPDGMFDVVHANEVLEHVDDPRTLVAEVSRILRPGGVVIFRTPNHKSWTASLLGPRWREYSLWAKGHVGFMAPRTLQMLLEGSGIRLLRVETRRFSVRDRWGKRRSPLRSLANAACRLLEPVARLARRGERLTVWGEKPVP